MIIPPHDEANIRSVLDKIEAFNFDAYDAILAPGVHYFSSVSRKISEAIRNNYNGLILQTSEGAVIKKCIADISLPMKDDILESNLKYFYYLKPRGKNIPIGWASDPDIMEPIQDPKNLRVLIDHTNYGKNVKKYGDHTKDILSEVEKLVDSDIWKYDYDSIQVKRIDTNKIADVDFENPEIEIYDPASSKIPHSTICREYGKAHIFIVTHHESLGLTALECAMAGALIITPIGCIHKDRLKTIRHYTHTISR